MTDYFFDRFARTCSFENEQGEAVGEMRAFISPLRYKNKMYLYGINTDIGYNTEGYYLYIGPPSPDITAAEGGYILCADEKYKIDRAEKVYRGDSVFYIWAVIRKTVETEESNE